MWLCGLEEREPRHGYEVWVSVSNSVRIKGAGPEHDCMTHVSISESVTVSVSV